MPTINFDPDNKIFYNIAMPTCAIENKNRLMIVIFQLFSKKNQEVISYF